VYVASVGSGECWVMQTGVGLQKAGASARALFQAQTFALSLSAGFACALTTAEIGDGLTGTEVAVITPGSTGPLDYYDVAGAARDRFRAAMGGSGQGLRCVEGRFVSIDRIVGRASDKKALARRTGAIGLDMESAALAQEAGAAQVPFVIVRTVSDLLEEDLPLDFNLFLRPTGWLKGIAAVLANPLSLMGLARLRRQSAAAAQTLSSVLRTSIETFFSERPGLLSSNTP
jgi:adenosylhomocysteine nucleosidase